ncbi:DUF488 domain-containing protein [Agromyces seonyuensis]|uniref:DUF488 family protein n=1 Tax=Agromyces seonyuensis TaxID=2662446 RepID=A0A6I4P3S9_9MICO|nr:DUF488 family protein [Agromyces seonyuensis]MWB98017.1 DUF488 family protein [Agromyces seonyuensis]
MVFAIKRIYDPADPADGTRILVDRLWPRGVSRERAELDEWAKDVSPSPELRTEWHHDPDRFDEFAARYRAELDDNPAAADLLARSASDAHVTLLFGARDRLVNHAHVLLDWLRHHGAEVEEPAPPVEPPPVE